MQDMQRPQGNPDGIPSPAKPRARRMLPVASAVLAVLAVLAVWLCGGFRILMGGRPGLTVLWLPVSFRVVDETTGLPVPGAEAALDWQGGMGEDGKTVHANADRLGIVNIEVPDILCGECEPAVPANRKFVCLEQLRIVLDVIAILRPWAVSF